MDERTERTPGKGRAMTNRPLTNSERSVFNDITSGDYDNLALIRTQLDGRDVAAIAAVMSDGGEYQVLPVAILVNDELFARMTAPDDAETIDKGK